MCIICSYFVKDHGGKSKTTFRKVHGCECSPHFQKRFGSLGERLPNFLISMEVQCCWIVPKLGQLCSLQKSRPLLPISISIVLRNWLIKKDVSLNKSSAVIMMFSCCYVETFGSDIVFSCQDGFSHWDIETQVQMWTLHVDKLACRDVKTSQRQMLMWQLS